ncbi:hypothetical protein SETIT_4G209200v2 [Setaria italica]|uniref:Uncharacterized protein n=1 Tax=Setaria italica TaxID=4555 RepID=A0A368QWH7_SETIT|nr:UPF0690 protein C1orf52 homolog isoform X1 [Setaria italica]RCV22291.1 hypothetical protein SETIT_4G209200v2 [Setaria italica]
MKRAAPWEEPQDVSSGGSSSADSDQEAGKGKFGSVSKAAAAAEDTKRGAPGEEAEDVSSDDSLSSDSDDEAGKGNGWNAFRLPNSSKAASPAEVAVSKRKKTGGVDFSALSRHGYRGGPSVLTVRPQEESNWSWSTGKDRDDKEDAPESYEERERTRAAVTEGEKLIGVQNAPLNQLLLEKDHKNASFSQKEKRKRDRGQASRGKNYVEEEKRLLRGSGVYSGFDI